MQRCHRSVAGKFRLFQFIAFLDQQTVLLFGLFEFRFQKLLGPTVYGTDNPMRKLYFFLEFNMQMPEFPSLGNKRVCGIVWGGNCLYLHAISSSQKSGSIYLYKVKVWAWEGTSPLPIPTSAWKSAS